MDSLQTLEQDEQAKQLIDDFGKKGLMTMLGFRSTVGSQTLVWPSKEALINGFNKRNTQPPEVDETTPPELVK